MTEDERKKRNDFNRKLFVLHKQIDEHEENHCNIRKSLSDLWLLNDDILEERDK